MDEHLVILLQYTHRRDHTPLARAHGKLDKDRTPTRVSSESQGEIQKLELVSLEVSEDKMGRSDECGDQSDLAGSNAALSFI